MHTDIVAHSVNGFPATTGQEFLEFLRGVAQSDPAKVQAFVGSHPKALAFVQAITPFPASFAKEKYFGLTAMKFTNEDGMCTCITDFAIIPAINPTTMYQIK